MSNSAFSDDFYNRWEHLISTVEISEIPLRLIREVSVTFNNGDITIFDVAHMLQSGHDVEVIEDTLEDFLEEHDDEVDRVDFFMNLLALAEEVDAKTSKLLDDN